MDLKDVLHAVRSGWWLLVSGFLVGVMLAGALSWLATPLYSSSTRLFVKVDAAADEAGLDRDLIASLYEQLIEASIAYEFEEFDRIRG